jgi:hypothetical protein
VDLPRMSLEERREAINHPDGWSIAANRGSGGWSQAIANVRCLESATDNKEPISWSQD